MLQLQDRTPFRSNLTAFPDPTGVQTLFITVKATFVLRPTLAVAEEQQALRLSDEYAEPPPPVNGERQPPIQPSLRVPGDISLCRIGTDVILNGTAYAPDGRPVDLLTAELHVGQRRHVVQVFGDRTWTGGRTGSAMTAPAPFVSMPLRYERAFGGTHVLSDQEVLYEERNPIGVGFVGRRRRVELSGLPLPNIEDPTRRLQEPGDTPAPIGFGAIAPAWLPRRGFAGTYDEKWQHERAPLLPSDFDPRFLQVAHPALIQPTHLGGGVPIELRNLTPEGRLNFQLPRLALEAIVQIGDDLERPPLRLEMMLILPDENRLELVFRGALGCDKRLLRVRQVEILLHSLELGGAAS